MNAKLMGKYLMVIGIIISFISSSEANVAFHKEGKYTVCVISGEITFADVGAVKNIVQSKGVLDRLEFWLNSSGGDLNAAMEIGKLIRKARATCLIFPKEKCYSACVLVLAGAVSRNVYGEVGIHRPYSTYVGGRDYESTQTEYRGMEATVRAYIRGMNLPEQLVDAMVRVPPGKIHILSDEELEAFGLNETDPVEQETEDAEDASRYGISKTECIRRKANVDKVCPQPDFFETNPLDPLGLDRKDNLKDWVDCKQAYMFGLDVPTYRERRKLAIKVCSGYKPGEEHKSCYLRVLRGNR